LPIKNSRKIDCLKELEEIRVKYSDNTASAEKRRDEKKEEKMTGRRSFMLSLQKIKKRIAQKSVQ